jgi:hypothetical protein
MPDIDHIRAEIEHMRVQVYRQRGEISQLQRAGIPTAAAEALLDRMLNNIDGLLRGARPAEKGAAQSVQRESARRASVVICPSP